MSGAAAGEQRARLARGALPAWPARSSPARARPRSRTARSRPREPREAARGPRRPGAERGTRAGEGDPGAQGMRRRTVAWSPCPTCSCLHPTPANGQILAPWHPGGATERTPKALRPSLFRSLWRAASPRLFLNCCVQGRKNCFSISSRGGWADEGGGWLEQRKTRADLPLPHQVGASCLACILGLVSCHWS